MGRDDWPRACSLRLLLERMKDADHIRRAIAGNASRRLHGFLIWRRREPALAKNAAGTASSVSRRLQNASRNPVDSSGFEWTPVTGAKGGKSQRGNHIASEVMRRQDVAESRNFVFDSRRLHHLTHAAALLSGSALFRLPTVSPSERPAALVEQPDGPSSRECDSKYRWALTRRISGRSGSRCSRRWLRSRRKVSASIASEVQTAPCSTSVRDRTEAG